MVELDEEPPQELNEKALQVAVKIGLMMNCFLFDEVAFMRKIIVDGSNTSGFQRTALIGVDGEIELESGKRIGIQGINLEEDSAKPIKRSEVENFYSLDRLGIPLIEISTDPDISTPLEVKQTAEKIGDYLRSFSEVKRGIGTIRQDLNISIVGGSRVELKGFQDLNLIPQIVDNEILRQLSLIELKRDVESLGFSKEFFRQKGVRRVYDLSDVFKDTKSKVISSLISDDKVKVLAVKLEKLKGFLGREVQDDYRVASEISDRVKLSFPQIKGLFHADELPNYGISVDEVDEVKKVLGVADCDNFVIICNEERVAREALLRVFDVLEKVLFGVSSEVRIVKGTVSVFAREMPGASRMYPETDVPVVDVKSSFESFSSSLPELRSLRLSRLSEKWGLEFNKIESVLRVFDEQKFDEFFKRVKPSKFYGLFFESSREVGVEECFEVEVYDYLLDLFLDSKLDKNIFKELLVKVFVECEIDSGLLSVRNFVESCVSDFDVVEVESFVKSVLSENSSIPRGALIGRVLAEFKGINGKRVSEIVSKFF